MAPGAPRLAPWIAGAEDAAAGCAATDLISPIDGKPSAAMVVSDDKVVGRAVASARGTFLVQRRTPLAERAAWLEAAAAEIDAAADEIIDGLIRDIGKPRRIAIFETRRSAQFIRLCRAEMVAMGGATLPLDATPAGAGRFGFTRRVPHGVIGAITPFNAPANLMVQKVAPALAMGNAVVVKPSPPGTPVSLMVARCFQRAGLPDGLLNIVPGSGETALLLAAHPQVALVSLTGSTAAAQALAQAAGAKPLLAELGSNAANIVCADADLEDAAKRIAGAAFEASGQQCISAQRVIVEAPVLDQFIELFVAAARALKVGDANDEGTDIGPMVGEDAARRVEDLTSDAVENGGRLALAAELRGATLGPAIVVAPGPGARLLAEEAFGPVAVVLSADDLDDALRIANDSRFGLQGACFTKSLETAFRVSDELEVGSLWINEGSRFRLDNYPFGGVKDSGFGREGARYALEAMSQLKFTGIRLGG